MFDIKELIISILTLLVILKHIRPPTPALKL